MKSGPLFLSILAASLFCFAACSSQCENEDGVAGDSSTEGVVGNSVGCQNPPVAIASLELSPVNGCVGMECAGGALAPATVTIQPGKKLGLEFLFPEEAYAPRVLLFIYPAYQAPGPDDIPLDTFELNSGTGFDLKPDDLADALDRNRADNPSAKVFAFNIHIRVYPISFQLLTTQEGLLAGLGLDVQRGEFISSQKPSWGGDFKESLGHAIRYFQGKVVSDSIDAGLESASSATVFIPGSPYSTSLNLQDSVFKIDGLPEGGFELRMLVEPTVIPDDGRLPIYSIRSGPGSGSERRFDILRIVDSVIVPNDN